MTDLSKSEELALSVIYRLEDNAYGVSIKRKIKELTGKNYKYGTLYFLLDNMTRKTLVERIEGEPTKERGGRRKIFYKITEYGLNSLIASIEMHEKVWVGLDRQTMLRG
ncbi:helix-turn-helix transcriptional regulator [bacterium]|nr:helix-turn-helix transcriptional regulator [bacterium]